MAKKEAKKKEAKGKKTGERTATAHETEQVEKREKAKKLAAGYLVQRDGMDAEMAAMVVEGMDPADIEALIVESNDKAIDAARNKGILPTKEEKPQAVDYLTIPELTAETPDIELNFAYNVVKCVAANETKKTAEGEYKARKKFIITKMNAAGFKRVSCEQIKLTVYPGKHRTLSELKLIEAGVDPAIVAKCWVETPYDDVKITMPGMKDEEGE